MNRRPHYAWLLSAGLAVGLAVGAAAYAERRESAKDALPGAEASGHITLIQAVQAAEAHAAGKASSAEYEHSRQGWVYDVEVVSGARVFDVRVNALNGAVMSSREDGPDREGGKDRED